MANFASFGAVIKGQNGVIKDSKIDGGTAQSLLLKGTINWQITGNIINKNVGGIAVDIRNGDPTPIASQVVLKRNDIEVSNGNLFTIGTLTTQEDGTSVFDNNEYSVIHDGTWGTARATTVSSLQEVRDAWTGVTTNDDNSREKAYGSESGNLVSILGTPITEATAGNLAGNLSVFFDNHDAATTKTVDDVGGGTASDIRDAIGMAAADLDTQLDAILAGSGGAGTMTWDELLADHQGAGTFGAIFQARQYYAPSGSTIRYVTRGDSYDGTANAKLSWPVAVDYTTGWTGTLTVRHRTTNAVLLTKAVVVASAVLLECTLTVTDSAFALLTDDDEFGSHPYDVQLDDGTSQITVVTNGVMIIRRDNTTV